LVHHTLVTEQPIYSGRDVFVVVVELLPAEIVLVVLGIVVVVVVVLVVVVVGNTLHPEFS